MASHASTVDDPEKHFLGNLLDEDSCYNTPLNQGSSSSPGAIPPVSVISGVGPISTNNLLRSYWPEPPPPYSPPIQSQWCSTEYHPFPKPPSSDFHIPSGQPTFITQPQIHHHHHNLHHHTHTHNVIENHHHYPITTVRVPSHGYSVNVLTENHPNFTSYHVNDHNYAPVESTRNVENDCLNEPFISSSAIPSLNKPVLSYRDVAAKIDQGSGGDSNSAAQGKRLQPQSDSDTRSCSAKARDFVSTEHTKQNRNHRDRKSKSAQVVEFQKITRKKVPVKKEKITRCDSANVLATEKTSAVDTPATKYEVLQNLTSKPLKSNSSVENILVTNREREPVRATMVYNERSRSSSLLPRTGPGTVIDVVARPKRAVDAEKKKQAHGNVVNTAQQRRRAVRKRSEFGWMERSVVVVSRLTFWMEFIFKWILNLVVDVSFQIYDVISYSMAHLLESIHSSARRMLLSMNTSVISGISSIRQLDVRRLLRSQEPEALLWGLEETITLPTTGEEALQRFLCASKCQDAYGVLGLQASCTEEDVRRHYKRLSALLNPEKNMLEGAEEAFELVTKAYQAISSPEARKTYNFTRIHPCKSDLHHDIAKLWDRIRERVEEARNSMYCDCGRRHSRIALDIRPNEARYCRRCKTRHPARANDIWVETRLCGLFWVYFTCCDGIVYDITDWATCEVNYLKHVRPNSHTVQYRLVSPGRSASDVPSQKHHNEKLRELADVAEELRFDWGRPGHAQVSYLPLEPRDEDRSRRAANRRQKKWR
uniref:Heat shock protein DnaJ domain containing protein n=1 Tax=Haemonchus contortus TaxID=6289 RepID=W6ND66_HAECO